MSNVGGCAAVILFFVVWFGIGTGMQQAFGPDTVAPAYPALCRTDTSREVYAACRYVRDQRVQEWERAARIRNADSPGWIPWVSFLVAIPVWLIVGSALTLLLTKLARRAT